MCDYQLPLFARYDMAVEFDRLVTHVRTTMRKSWSKYSRINDDEIPRHFYCEVCQLEMLLEDMSCKTEVGPNFTSYEFSIPFLGDEGLWSLYPVEPLEDLLGEVFRGNLILEFGAQDEATARRYLQRDLDEITQILDQQAGRIEVFHKAVPSIIRAEAAKLRSGSPAYSSKLH